MSYLQAYGHPPVLTVDSGIGSWSDASDCETLRSAPAFSRLGGANATTHATRQTLLQNNGRPSNYRNVTATGPRCIKRRITANKKERRRTESINNAFAELRGCIPQVPADTKLSKIKTLRLASSYIAHLMDQLANDEAESPRPFKAQLATENEHPSTTGDIIETSRMKIRKPSGRTGWPQHVWALELKRENPS